MSAPRVKLHPDGRAVVRARRGAKKPWIAVSSTGLRGTYLDIESFSDEDAQEWSNYFAPLASGRRAEYSYGDRDWAGES